MLPMGTYYLVYWIIERLDQEGSSWTLKGNVGSTLGPFKVTLGGTTPLDVGGPIQAQVEQYYTAGVVWNFRAPALTGRLGETVSLTRKDSELPLQMRIRNRSGDYDRTFTFEYG